MFKLALTAVALATLLATALATRTTPPTTKCGGRCGGYMPPCVKGTTCVAGVCKARNLTLGKACSKCKQCKSPYICKNGKCAEKAKPASACGGTCNGAGFPNKCSDGSVCRSRKCVKPSQGLGQSCAKSCETCKKPLMCQRGKCVAKLVACGGSCRGGVKCQRGLLCRGGTCKQTNVASGGRCGACRVCRYGYRCMGGKCDRPVSKCGGRCGRYSGRKCGRGLVCSGRRCVKVVGCGQLCGGCNQCKRGSTCNGRTKRCVKRSATRRT